MNAQQRRKERRKREINRKFNIGDKVRIDHKHKDDFDTMKTYSVESYGWNHKVQRMLYALEGMRGVDFNDEYILLDIKSNRRENLEL